MALTRTVLSQDNGLATVCPVSLEPEFNVLDPNNVVCHIWECKTTIWNELTLKEHATSLTSRHWDSCTVCHPPYIHVSIWHLYRIYTIFIRFPFHIYTAMLRTWLRNSNFFLPKWPWQSLSAQWSWIEKFCCQGCDLCDDEDKTVLWFDFNCYMKCTRHNETLW